MEVLFATSNPHKVREANKAASAHGVVFQQISLVYPELRAESVSEVAKDGAEYVRAHMSRPCIVEDSGLYIDALNGFPGPYSAYAFHKLGCQGILDLMRDVEDRGARFVSAIGYAGKDGVVVFEGVCEGRIAFELLGDKGFGFDPIFVPSGSGKTFGQDVKAKDSLSHRRMAVEEFCRHLAGGAR